MKSRYRDLIEQTFKARELLCITEIRQHIYISKLKGAEASPEIEPFNEEEWKEALKQLEQNKSRQS